MRRKWKFLIIACLLFFIGFAVMVAVFEQRLARHNRLALARFESIKKSTTRGELLRLMNDIPANDSADGINWDVGQYTLAVEFVPEYPTGSSSDDDNYPPKDQQQLRRAYAVKHPSWLDIVRTKMRL